jgi:DNA polymerase III alpha subunit (gram-positive type)
MIIFDTETTGLLKANIVDLDKQPKIIELAAIKLDDKTLEEVDRIEFLVNPKESLEKIITKITGLTDNKLKDAKTFEYHYEKLADFFLGEKYLLAHNIAFDMGMLKNDLARIGRLTQFPYPPIQICTVVQTFQIKGYRLNLSKMHQHLFGEDFPEAHRAMNDVEALTRCVKNLINNQIIKL